MAGAKMLRIDTPGPSKEMLATQYYSASALYSVTPCDEAMVRATLKTVYELPDPVRLALYKPDQQRMIDTDEEEPDIPY